MFNVPVPTVALFLTACGAPLGEQNVENSKAELAAAGLSPQAIDGITQIWNKFASEKPAEGSQDYRAAVNKSIRLITEADAFMKTQSPADQAAFEAFNAKKKAALEAEFNGQK